MALFLPLLYLSLAIVLIHRSDFFSVNGLNKKAVSLLFIIKIAFGLAFWAVYSFYYTQREFSDCLRFFDDAGIIFNSIKSNPLTYLKIITGIKDHNDDAVAVLEKVGTWKRDLDRNFLYNDNRTILRLNAVIYLFSFGNYHVHTVFMSFLSFSGLTALYHFFSKNYKGNSHLLVVSIFLIPSVLFWTSGIVKEALIVFALGFTLYYFDKIIEDTKQLKLIVFFLLSFTILFFAKAYFAIAIIFPLITFYAASVKKNPVYTYLISSLVLLLIIILTDTIAQSKSPLKLLSKKQNDFMMLSNGGLYFITNENNPLDTFYVTDEFAKEYPLTENPLYLHLKTNTPYYRWKNNKVVEDEKHFISDSSTCIVFLNLGKVGSSIELKKIDNNIWRFISGTPSYLFNVLARPHVFESKKIFYLLIAVENLIILLLCIIVLFLSDKKKSLSNNRFLFGMYFFILAATIIGAGTPVMGALVRYKAPLIPLFVSSFIILTENRITRFIKN